MLSSSVSRPNAGYGQSDPLPLAPQRYTKLFHFVPLSDVETYTEQDVREVAEFAKIYGVQVIPESDYPAHVGNGWNWGPERGMTELGMFINHQP